jgi:hypothetical protein
MIKIPNFKQDRLGHLDLELGIYLEFVICDLKLVAILAG